MAEIAFTKQHTAFIKGIAISYLFAELIMAFDRMIQLKGN